MILSYAYDVEILPNFFSITIVDVGDYLRTFADACVINKKGNKIPVPLTQIYTVEEIKEKLDKVQRKCFYITDTGHEYVRQHIEEHHKFVINFFSQFVSGFLVGVLTTVIAALILNWLTEIF